MTLLVPRSQVSVLQEYFKAVVEIIFNAIGGPPPLSLPPQLLPISQPSPPSLHILLKVMQDYSLKGSVLKYVALERLYLKKSTLTPIVIFPIFTN